MDTDNTIKLMKDTIKNHEKRIVELEKQLNSIQNILREAGILPDYYDFIETN